MLSYRVIFASETRGQREHSIGDGRTYSLRAPTVTGMLPYSRLTHIPITVRAMTPATIAFLSVSHFPEMLDRLPSLRSKLVGVLADRIRETTRTDQQREKLMTLGRLSAGMAHELNNPAAAVRSAARSLQEAVVTLQTVGMRLDQRELRMEDRIFLAQIECEWLKEHPARALEPLEPNDREEATGDWLMAHQVPNARQLAADLWWMPDSMRRRCNGYRRDSMTRLWPTW